MSEPIQEAGGRRFFDSHLHAFDLTHPNLIALLSRFTYKPLVAKLVSGVALFLTNTPLVSDRFAKWFIRTVYRVLNLLAVMENDLGCMFLLMEACLRGGKAPLLDKNGLHVGAETYSRIVLTPLMIDFDTRNTVHLRQTHRAAVKRQYYHRPVARKFDKQRDDLVRGIMKYEQTGGVLPLPRGVPSLQGTRRAFEIRPFLGINPRNYAPRQLVQLLAQSFPGSVVPRYPGREALPEVEVEADSPAAIDFIGVKVYPPLGFDPWPDERLRRGESKKVKFLYEFCTANGIPITSHGGSGGFVVLKRRRLKEYTDIEKWEAVVDVYPKLKLCIAHLPMKEKIFKFIPDLRHPLRKAMIRLARTKPNVYVDISCRATNAAYYRKLKETLDRHSHGKGYPLRDKVLFGTDFSINLMWIESYTGFLRLFSETERLDDAERTLLCSTNPERFLS